MPPELPPRVPFEGPRPDRALAWVDDVRDACARIADVLRTASAVDLTERAVLRAALERYLLIAGEAMVRLREHAPELGDRFPEQRQVIGLRNALAHGYDVIDAVRFEHIVRNDVPVLGARAAAILAEVEHDPRYRP